MTLPASFIPTTPQPTSAPGKRENAPSRSVGLGNNSFDAVLDRTVAPAPERSSSRSSNARSRLAVDRDTIGSRISRKSIKPERKKALQEVPENFAPFGASVPVVTKMVEAEPSQNRQSSLLGNTLAKAVSFPSAVSQPATESRSSLSGQAVASPAAANPEDAVSSVNPKPVTTGEPGEPEALENRLPADSSAAVDLAGQPMAADAMGFSEIKASEIVLTKTAPALEPRQAMVGTEVKPDRTATTPAETAADLKLEESLASQVEVEDPNLNLAAGGIEMDASNPVLVAADLGSMRLASDRSIFRRPWQTSATGASIAASVTVDQPTLKDNQLIGAERAREKISAGVALTPPLPSFHGEPGQGGPPNVVVEISPDPNATVEDNQKLHGIASAQEDEQMKSTVKQDENAGSAKQLLPAAQPAPARPARADDQRESKRGQALNAATDALLSPALTKQTAPTSSTEFLLATDALGGKLSPVDRMTKVISREIQMFKRTADETMEVVLTPDQHTQISLRLQWREGKVEILAHCSQGDYHALNLQWPQLQSALGHQGVRLSQLTQPSHTGYTEFFTSNGFSQSQHEGRRPPQPLAGFDDLPAAAVVQPARKTQSSIAARARHLLESWA